MVMKKKQIYRFFPLEITEEYLRETTAELRKQAPDCPELTFADVGRYAIVFSADWFGSWSEMERYANRVRRVLDLLDEFEEKNPSADVPL
jgi:hypothetical protein